MENKNMNRRDFSAVFDNHDFQFNVPRNKLMNIVAGRDGCLYKPKP